jgi:GTPase SAR1 family protein
MVSLLSETQPEANRPSADEQASRPPIPVKIIVSGGFGVGKTTLVGALS